MVHSGSDSRVERGCSSNRLSHFIIVAVVLVMYVFVVVGIVVEYHR